jgi:arylsulfatase A-like enzyme
MKNGNGYGFLWSGIRWGALVGFLFTMVEGLKNILLSMRLFHYEQPLHVILITVVFNLALGGAIGLVAAPLLKLRRGRLWFGLACMVMLAAVLLVVSPPFASMAMFDVVIVSLVAVLYFVSVWLLGRPRLAKAALLLGCAVTAGAYAVPRWLAPVETELEPPVSTAPAKAPNILMIVVDTVRSDRLDLFGYQRPTFPWLTSFAREGATFARALSAAPWTVPSHASMFTGLFPSGHGAHHERTYLDASKTTLAEILHQHGWETLAFSSNAWISESTGLGQGFGAMPTVWTNWLAPMTSLAYRLSWQAGLMTRDHSGREVTDEWVEWLENRSSERPFFAFLNYIEPHIPYHVIPDESLLTFAPQGTTKAEVIDSSLAVQEAERSGAKVSEEDAQRVRDLYDSAIRYEDGLVEAAVEVLRDQNLLDQTIVVVVSDHGHLMGEHGMFDHSRSVTEQLLAVPLVMRYPARIPAGMWIETPVTTAALMPTMLDLAGLPPAEKIHTRSFAPLFDGDVDAARSPLLAESHRDAGNMAAKGFQPRSEFDRLGVRYRAIEEDGFKLVIDSTGLRWLFRPQADPSETTNLASQYPEVVADLEAKLAFLVDSYRLGPIDGEATDSPDVELDPAVEERLRALGYLG